MRDTGWTNNGNCLWERYVEDDHGDRILGVCYTIPLLTGGSSYVNGFRAGHEWQHVGIPGGTDIHNAKCAAILYLLQNWPPAMKKTDDLAEGNPHDFLGRYIASKFGDDETTALEELPGIVADTIGTNVTDEDIRRVYRSYRAATKEARGSVAP